MGLRKSNDFYDCQAAEITFTNECGGITRNVSLSSQFTPFRRIKMTKKLRAPSFLYAIFFISILFQYGLNAHKYTNLIIDAEASNQVGITQHQVSIQQVKYVFSNSDPTYLSAIIVTVSSSEMNTTQLEVSMDGGAKWHTCRSTGSLTWDCTFSPGTEPLVAGVKSITARDQN